MEEIFKKIVKSAISRVNFESDIFDSFIHELINYHDKPANSISELKQKLKTNKFKGPIFEFFCKQYFEKIVKVENVWLLKECPLEVLNQLSMTKKDYGIDLVVQSLNGRFSPVQCKFKNPKKLSKKLEMKYHYQNVTWRDLSTFYSLCARTGPEDSWEKLIVFTNAQYVGRKGKKNEKDKSICYNTFNKLTIEEFRLMIGEEGTYDKCEKVEIQLVQENEILEKRITFFNAKIENSLNNIIN